MVEVSSLATAYSVLVCWVLVRAEVTTEALPECGEIQSCHACVRSAAPTCNWCEEGALGQSRCLAEREVSGCRSGTLQDLNSEYQADPTTSSATPLVHVTPQRLGVKIRAGDSVDIPLSMRFRNSNPVDIYFLLDISRKSKSDFEGLDQQAQTLASGIQAFSSSVHVGYGTFVDKKMLPYFDEVSSKDTPSEQCDGERGFCNALALKAYNADEFKEALNKIHVMGDQDSPEGGLDALMQVLTCQKQLRWRQEAIKFVVVLTDGSFHYAGDGKLAGLYRTHDGRCHVDDEGVYTAPYSMDYPSVWQITEAAEQHSIRIVFAVKQAVQPLYEQLALKIPLSTTANWQQYPSSIISQMVNRLTFTTRRTPEHIKVSFSNSCPAGDGEAVCAGLQSGTEARVTATVTLEECPASGWDTKDLFEISTFEFPLPYSTVHLEYLCSCDL